MAFLLILKHLFKYEKIILVFYTTLLSLSPNSSPATSGNSGDRQADSETVSFTFSSLRSVKVN